MLMHQLMYCKDQYDLAVVGGGVAGSAILIQIVKTHMHVHSQKTIRIVIFDPYELGEGIASSHKEKFILCNTGVDSNSLYPDDPEHFLNWLNAHPDLCGLWDIEVDSLEPSSFVPRGLLKQYVVQHVNMILALSGQFGFDILHRWEVVASIKETVNGFLVKPQKNPEVSVKNLVIATGLCIPNVPFRNIDCAENAYIASPYDISPKSERVQNCSSVVILGTRQSAVDAVLLVNDIAPSCKIMLMSRSARFPCVRTYMVEHKTCFFTYNNLLENLSLEPDKFAEYWDEMMTGELYNASLSKVASGDLTSKPALNDEFLKLTAVRELYQDLLTTLSYGLHGSPWEHIDRGIITITNEIWPVLSNAQRKSVAIIMKPFIRHKVSAIPAVNARKIINLARRGILDVTKGPSKICTDSRGSLFVYDDYNCRHSAEIIINATGFLGDKKWDHLRQNSSVLNNTNKVDTGGLFFLGPASGDSLAISNYMNATVRQACSIARKLQARFKDSIEYTDPKRRTTHA